MIKGFKWLPSTEFRWMAAIVISLFLFSYKESKDIGNKLDAHILQTNQGFAQVNLRIDDVNKRADDLHKEFYALLKEMNKNNKD